jgi:ABC-type cobalamin/Fe3+-siderophores transport system ATPase subunit
MHNGVVFCHGRPAELLTAGTIREVYGVEAAVRMENGHLFVHPLQCAGRL